MKNSDYCMVPRMIKHLEKDNFRYIGKINLGRQPIAESNVQDYVLYAKSRMDYLEVDRETLSKAMNAYLAGLENGQEDKAQLRDIFNKEDVLALCLSKNEKVLRLIQL